MVDRDLVTYDTGMKSTRSRNTGGFVKAVMEAVRMVDNGYIK